MPIPPTPFVGEPTDTSPFPGALACYRLACKLLAWMGTDGGHLAVAKRNGRSVGFVASDEMRGLRQALEAGDEQAIRHYLGHPEYKAIVDAP